MSQANYILPHTALYTFLGLSTRQTIYKDFRQSIPIAQAFKLLSGRVHISANLR